MERLHVAGLDRDRAIVDGAAFEGSRRFNGVQSLIGAQLAFFDDAIIDRTLGPDMRLAEIANHVRQHGDLALPRQVWEHAWLADAPSP